MRPAPDERIIGAVAAALDALSMEEVAALLCQPDPHAREAPPMHPRHRSITAAVALVALRVHTTGYALVPPG